MHQSAMKTFNCDVEIPQKRTTPEPKISTTTSKKCHQHEHPKSSARKHIQKAQSTQRKPNKPTAEGPAALNQAMGPLNQATGPAQSDAGVGIGTLIGDRDYIVRK